MSWADWLLVCDAVALAGYCVGVVWVGSLAWAELRRPAPVRRPGHYGERAE